MSVTIFFSWTAPRFDRTGSVANLEALRYSPRSPALQLGHGDRRLCEAAGHRDLNGRFRYLTLVNA